MGEYGGEIGAINCEKKVGDEQGGLRRRKSFLDQVLTIKMLMKE